jgi:hypothetical protein
MCVTRHTFSRRVWILFIFSQLYITTNGRCKVIVFGCLFACKTTSQRFLGSALYVYAA